MNWLKQHGVQTFWQRLRRNPWFVSATMAFAGTLASEIEQAGGLTHIALNAHNIHNMLLTALGAVAIALYHLYLQPPSPALPAGATVETVTLQHTTATGDKP